MESAKKGIHFMLVLVSCNTSNQYMHDAYIEEMPMQEAV